MGLLETKSRQRTRRNQLRKLILETVQGASIISIALVAPNVVGAMGKLGMLPSSRQRDVVVRSTKRLVKTGLLTWRDSSLLITAKGKRVLRILEAQESLKQPRRWDKKWRVLIFDIPERRKSIRVRLRETVRSFGLVRLQDSVWVYPYDCEDLITLLKAELRLGDDVRYLICESIERDEKLRKYFQLRP